MAIVEFTRPVSWPPVILGGALAFQSSSIFNASHAYACVFQVPRTGNIRTVRWATRTVTTGATIDLRLETVDLATGDPSGTLVGTNTNASVVIANADDDVFFSTTLTADAAVTVGDVIAFVLQNPAVSSGSILFPSATLGDVSNVPYGDHLQASYAKNTNVLMFALEYSDGAVVPIPGVLPPATALVSTSVSTSSTPDVYGMLFEAPMAMRVIGAWIWMDRDGDCNLRLVNTAYNQGAGTGVLASAAVDANVRNDASSSVTAYYFTSSVDLVPGTSYRLIWEPTTTTTSSFTYLNTGSLSSLDAWGFGCLTTAKDPTSNADWTNYNSGTFRWAPMGLIVSGVDTTPSGGLGGAFTFVG
jgi:hypothetical protein